MDFSESFANVPNRQPLLAHILRADGALAEDDLNKALRVWYATRKEGPGRVRAFGEVLIARGLFSPETLEPYIAMQRALALPPQGGSSLGALILQNGLLRPAQLIEALRIQRHTHQRLGEVLVSEGYLSKAQLAPLLRLQGRKFTARLPGHAPRPVTGLLKNRADWF